jgi:polysaccharide export outer membrane protein
MNARTLSGFLTRLGCTKSFFQVPLFVLALALAGCTDPHRGASPNQSATLQSVGPAAGIAGPGDISAYRLGPGDKVKVTVFGQQQESGTFEIDGSGNMAYPLLGNVPAQGLTVSELQERLRTELDRKFIVNPRVTIEVQAYRPFYIYGEVQKAGSYPFVTGLTVRRAVAIAGGYTRRARYAPVHVVREAVNGPREIILELDMPVLPGDTIQVMQRLF